MTLVCMLIALCALGSHKQSKLLGKVHGTQHDHHGSSISSLVMSFHSLACHLVRLVTKHAIKQHFCGCVHKEKSQRNSNKYLDKDVSCQTVMLIYVNELKQVDLLNKQQKNKPIKLNHKKRDQIMLAD